jgi:hypothetical protein
LISSTPIETTQLAESSSKASQVYEHSSKNSIEFFYDDIGKLDYAECKSQEARAKWLVDNKRVKHYTEDKIYHVKSDNAKMYTVILNSKPECTCIAKNNCVHILACKYINGEDISDKNPVRIALSKLVANKRNNKASGKKHFAQYQRETNQSFE